MNKKISIICPTHRRKELQTRFAKNVYDNCSNSDLCEIVFGIDNNDEIALETYDNLKNQYGEHFIRAVLINPGENIPNISNICFPHCRGQIIGNAADDVVFRSKDWDQTVINEFSKYPDKILLLWSDDGLWGGSLASHYFLHENWIKTTGHVQPTFFHADWTDHWNQKLANNLGRGVLIRDRNKLFLEHLHAEFNGMEKDETYWKMKERREKNVAEGLSFHKPTPEMKAAHELEYLKLKKFIEEFKNE